MKNVPFPIYLSLLCVAIGSYGVALVLNNRLIPTHVFGKEDSALRKGLVVSHILGSCIALLLGPFQFNRKINTEQSVEASKTTHYVLGYAYFLCVVFGGFTGMYIGQTNSRNNNVTKVGFTSLGVLWYGILFFST